MLTTTFGTDANLAEEENWLLRNEIDALRDEIADLHAQLADADSQTASLEMRLRESRVPASDERLRAENERLKAELAALESHNDQLSADARSMRTQLDRTRQELTAAEARFNYEIRAELANQRSHYLNEIESQREQSDRKLTAAHEEIGAMRVQRDSLQAKLRAAEKFIAELPDADVWELRDIKADIANEVGRQCELVGGRPVLPTGLLERRCDGPEMWVEADVGWRVVGANVQIKGLLFEIDE